ncbi:hypothetical protein OSB04_020906 [Centaurea solstitialis]|uniref:Zinc finger PHD-type domain-containing protein n=1 Tax=Centaurea solstitialis TaxID=347529 RepID=A0AA38TCU4_9ASTR|nr:hypothetical protein OSB04_020906 [Centaurea solstitialis]
MKVPEHEHPLDLIDLEEKYADDTEEESDDDENNDLAIAESFRCRCHRCGRDITRYHKSYYKCSSDSCDYSIHKFCGELPSTLTHTAHNAHPLVLQQEYFIWRCSICQCLHKGQQIHYGCSSCYFKVDIDCAMVATEVIIHHPSHTHPLVPITRPILCRCDACGKKHQGDFYHCTTCTSFFIHSDCVSLPKTLILEQATDGDQKEKSYPRCRICDDHFIRTTTLWIYKCDKCWFYTHLACATSKEEPFMSILSSKGLGKINKTFEDADYPDLLTLPFPNETHNMLKHISFKKNGSQSTKDEGNLTLTLTHWSHQHPLTLVDADITKPSSSSSSSKRKLVHNPMKKIELLCNGCVRPITSTPFYMCADEGESCNFALHEWCTRLPDQVQNHPGHPQHTLLLLPNPPHKPLGVFECDVCKFRCNGFAYSCVECGNYNTDVTCAFIPEKIRHEAHPNHLIWGTPELPYGQRSCRSCLNFIRRNNFSFCCRDCDFGLHVGCALFLPQTIRHRFDKHPLMLSYLPIENHRSLYFCEICEEQFDPKRWFYHCYECRQSIYCGCAPFILECEKAFPYLTYGNLYMYVNIKFGGMHNTEDHPHPLSFVQGIDKDGRHCHKCKEALRDWQFILKCLQCTFAIHFRCDKFI